ncbi:CLUMA_CG005296, isoform A [Clunio marinus]|uniref:alpha-glucosidase n=1 Tax=Clunio marinus TaxID=568069 RepID=A0A1J1HYN0_9DIPT|nr:CLUMA_CG005296, isoform A [Clunio marinus]
MSQEKLSSNKLDIEGAQQRSSADEKLKETYKPISEDFGSDLTTGDAVKNSNMARENGDPVKDGADEKMLEGSEKENLALKNVEVKFISGDSNPNGDAKIDIGNIEKAFTGMTKEELMKYANDPFWVRLRWILFIFFWALWIAMLAGAISIIVFAPKCAAPTPLVWWKKGPLITIDGSETEDVIKEIKNYNAKGVVYELSGDETYFVDTPLVESKIKKLVETYKANDIHVVLDLTANYVTKEDKLFKEATEAVVTPEVLSAFVTANTADLPNNWKKVHGTEPAWKKEGKLYFLSQFEDNYDLQMTSPVAQKKLSDVLTHLVALGVKGFRLLNAQHFIINPELRDEIPDRNHNHGMNEYGFFTHGQTIYQDDLGKVIRNFTRVVHNVTDNAGFLTIRDDSAVRAEVFVDSKLKHFTFDLPYFKFLETFLKSSKQTVPKQIYNGFANLNGTVDDESLWIQLSYKPENFKGALDASGYNIFMGFLRGVQITSINALNYNGSKSESMKKLEEARESQVFQHGKFEYFLSHNETAFGYTRTKSGMPGYFIAMNPTDEDIKANFTFGGTALELSVLMLSDGFNDNPLKSKIISNEIPLTKHSVAVFTFVPQ